MLQRKAHDIGDRERTKDIHIDENVDFESMYLSEYVLQGLKGSGFQRPSPIQLAAIPLGRCGLDMIVQAKSGTGKTCVFAVVALEMVSVSSSSTQVLVLTPTREIAVQVTQVINTIGSEMCGLKASTFIGGIHISVDRAKLHCCHIAVGTPGRITQLIEMRLLRLDNVRLLVLDEADQLLTGQFADGIVHIASALPLNKQVIALSATYTEDVAKVAEGLMRSPNHVRLGKDSPALLGVNQFVKLLPFHRQPHRRQQMKFIDLVNILSKVTFNQCLVFSNSQLRAESICNKLRASGWPVSFLTGGQAQRDRLIALDALCSYKCRILVSTDLSARGLDSEHVNLVINLDMPRDHATYLHRVGRAGRFGSRGLAITLATEGDEWLAMRAIASLANVQIYVIKGDWVPDMTNIDGSSMDCVDFMSEEEFAQYMLVSSTHKYDDRKNSDSKSKKEILQKGKNIKTLCESLTETCQNKTHVSCVQENFQNSKMPLQHVHVCADSSAELKRPSKDHSMRNKKQLLEKKLMEGIRNLKAENSRTLLNMLKKLNFEQTNVDFCFDNILLESSEKYSHVSANDNPLIEIPVLPDALEISEAQLKALKGHWESVEEDLQEIILNIDEAWEDVSFTVENALQSRMEGEDNVKFFENIGKGKEKEESHDVAAESISGAIQVNDNGTPVTSTCRNNLERTSECIGSETNDTQLSGEVCEYVRKMSSSYGRQKQYYHGQSSEANANVRRRIKRGKCNKNKKDSEDDNLCASWQHACTLPCNTDLPINPQLNVHSCDNMGDLNSYGCFNESYENLSNRTDECNTSHTDLENNQLGNDQENTYLNHEDFFRSSLNMYQKYLDSTEKFVAMMDYVQTMGKMSSWIARDYHLGLEKK